MTFELRDRPSTPNLILIQLVFTRRTLPNKLSQKHTPTSFPRQFADYVSCVCVFFSKGQTFVWANLFYNRIYNDPGSVKADVARSRFIYNVSCGLRYKHTIRIYLSQWRLLLGRPYRARTAYCT